MFCLYIHTTNFSSDESKTKVSFVYTIYKYHADIEIVANETVNKLTIKTSF